MRASRGAVTHQKPLSRSCGRSIRPAWRSCYEARPRRHSVVHRFRQASFHAGTWCRLVHTARWHASLHASWAARTGPSAFSHAAGVLPDGERRRPRRQSAQHLPRCSVHGNKCRTQQVKQRTCELRKSAIDVEDKLCSCKAPFKGKRAVQAATYAQLTQAIWLCRPRLMHHFYRGNSLQDDSFGGASAELTRRLSKGRGAHHRRRRR